VSFAAVALCFASQRVFIVVVVVVVYFVTIQSGNFWSHPRTSTPPVRLHGVVLSYKKHRDNFTCTLLLYFLTTSLKRTVEKYS
jgi:hypothetical protein